jgi:hypothetical protein
MHPVQTGETSVLLQPMRVLKLHLFQPVSGFPVNPGPADIFSPMQIIREADRWIRLHGSEQYSCTELTVLLKSVSMYDTCVMTAQKLYVTFDPPAFGERASVPQESIAIRKGDYLFLQFSPSAGGKTVQKAAETLLAQTRTGAAADSKAETVVYLRIVHEKGGQLSDRSEDYAFQFITALPEI